MKRKLFILAFSLHISFLMSGSIQTYQICGKISKSMNDKQIMLFKMLCDSIISVDTTTIINGSFIFKGSGKFVDVAILTAGNYPDKVYSTEVIIEDGIISVDMDSLKVTGKLNELYSSYFSKMKEIHDRIVVEWEKDNHQEPKRGSIRDKLNKERDSITLNTIRSNISNAVGYRLFDNEIVNMDISQLQYFDSIFPADIKPEELIKEVILERKIWMKRVEESESKVGRQYHDFELQTPENQKRLISDFVGKSRYVYIDFWASWCGPCIADIPKLITVFERYKNKGLVIVGLSIDESFDVWKNAVKRVKTPWVQLSVLENNRSQLKNFYNVMSIPQGILVDQNGKIVAKLRGSEDLENFLIKMQ